MKLTDIQVALGAIAIAAASLSAGCTTESYCFEDCVGEGSGATGATGATGGAGGAGATGGFAATGGGGFAANGGGGAGGDTCVPAEEVCDGVDNDCDDEIDEWEDVPAAELEKATSCGNCETNCFDQFGINYEPPTCTPPTTPGEPGTCTSQCVADFYDLDPNAPGCEYYCPYNPDGTNTTDPGGADGCGKDDDCDGQKDEDVNVCDDVTNCGRCGKQCFISNGTAKCVTTATDPSQCDLTNTGCEIDQCDSGFADNNGSADDGCEYECPVFPTTAEVCDGLDNDCDGLIDNADPDLATATGIGDGCFGDPDGLCATTAHQGVQKCIGGNIRCCDPDSSGTGTPDHLNGVCDAATGTQVLREGETAETCNSIDDDCDGYVDGAAAGSPAACTTDADCNITERCIAPVGSTTTVCVAQPIDVGGTCGSSVGNCQAGRFVCNSSGARECVGATPPATSDPCNGQDDDCDGVLDGTVTGTPVTCTSNANCTAPQICLPQAGTGTSVCADPASDAGGTCGTDAGVCVAGTWACTGGTLDCAGDVGKTADVDRCGEDSNCDNALTNQPDLQSDVRNCGTCGNDCYANNPGSHGIWSCVSGQCQRTDCEFGYVDCDTTGVVAGDGDTATCEFACSFTSSTEQCNGADDNCDCAIDNDLTSPPDPTAVCGVSPLASDTGCTSGVTVACSNGDWTCSFPSGYCTGTAPEYCTTEFDACDGLDNNCDGAIDENFKQPILNQGYLTQVCYSDDGQPPPGDGVCRTQGTYKCSSLTATSCQDASNNPLTPDLTKAGTEVCDGADNDCDGVADEVYNSTTGSGDGNYVSPAVVDLGGGLFIYQYEASRPDATAITAGSGNGYHSSAPSGVPLDATLSCSEAGSVPWFNVTPEEAEQTCLAVGGRLCTLSDWQTACWAQNTCLYGYAPDDTTCVSPGVYAPTAGDPSCNIGPFDFDADPFNGNQDGVLPGGSSLLTNCFADWGGATNGVFDIMGNLREITVDGANYTMMGGAFNTATEAGASCDFTFYTVDPAQNPTFKLYDVGFRCCFDTDPR